MNVIYETSLSRKHCVSKDDFFFIEKVDKGRGAEINSDLLD